MANVTNEFIANPAEFLTKYVVQVSNTGELGPKNLPGVQEFSFTTITETAVALGKASGDKLSAYWLPWKSGDATSMDLGGDADYFFTSQMTNCRFSVLSSEEGTTKVAHIAGTLSKTKRNEAEEEKLGKGARRLSVSGSSGRAPVHSYSGQNPRDPGSAFVYGLRDKISGAWTFEAQIVKMALVQGVDLRHVETPTIAQPFKF